MRVLLRADVDRLGKRGDIVEVSDGYARNHLAPAGLVIAATDGVQAQATAMRRARDLRDAKDRESAEAVARAVTAKPIVVTARAGGGGRLYGSVTSADVAEAIRAQTGAVVDRRKIDVGEPIRSVGAHQVSLRLHGEVTTEVTVEVTAG